MIRSCLACLLVLLPLTVAAGDLLSHRFVSIEGRPLPLKEFRGRPLLVVNTASLCGFTPQYRGLQALWERYRAQGLTVLGVPSNDFGGQEPGSNADIAEFCSVNFAVDFPMTEKVGVTGPASHPLFVDLRRELGADAGPRWNFYKFLIDGEGEAVAAWPSSTPPDDPALLRAIDLLLAGVD